MKYILSLILFFYVPLHATDFVTADVMGQLGNQMFIIAATVSHALDHGATPTFPDFIRKSEEKIPLNYQKLFRSLSVVSPKKVRFTYREPQFSYVPIPYKPNMKISGWFQSEKYFANHKQEILELFAPPSDVMDYISANYADILEYPKTVSIHYRSYYSYDPTGKWHPTCKRDYFEKAMAHFPDEETLFVVFSNEIEECKELLSGLRTNIRFIEGEDHFCDLYLMSFCKDNIISNSSFSWWGAYLNRNPDKRVIAPKLWFNLDYKSDLQDLLPEGWIGI